VARVQAAYTFKETDSAGCCLPAARPASPLPGRPGLSTSSWQRPQSSRRAQLSSCAAHARAGPSRRAAPCGCGSSSGAPGRRAGPCRSATMSAAERKRNRADQFMTQRRHPFRVPHVCHACSPACQPPSRVLSQPRLTNLMVVITTNPTCSLALTASHLAELAGLVVLRSEIQPEHTARRSEAVHCSQKPCSAAYEPPGPTFCLFRNQLGICTTMGARGEGYEMTVLAHPLPPAGSGCAVRTL
jgi:hypothetical protein